MSTIDLYIILNPSQMRACRASGFREIQPETVAQQFLFLKVNREHAEGIAQSWTAKHYGAAYVVRLSVSESLLDKCKKLSVAYKEHEEYRLKINDLPVLCWYLRGLLTVVTVYWEPRPQQIGEVVSFG